MFENYNRWNPCSSYTSELYHSGIPGMHWGVRRFQNYDGSYTEAGKERYGRGENDDEHKSKKDKSKEDVEQSKKKKDKNPVEKVTSGIAKSSSAASRIVQRYSKKKNYVSPASKMSDDDLRRVINRMNLERQYDQLTNADTKAGYDKVRDIIDTTGDVAVTVGGLTSAIVGGIEIYKFFKGR